MLKIGSIKGVDTRLTALVPSISKKYVNDTFEVIFEKGGGLASFFHDEDYEQVELGDRSTVIQNSDLLLLADATLSDSEIASIKDGATLIGRFSSGIDSSNLLEALASRNVSVIDVDRIPRSSIAQSMDVLSSLASLAGYKAVLNAANFFSGYFPMMTTAAGTVPPAKVLILGAGVAGLQAIATARRLGAVVEAFDVRSAVKEEVESLGAKFIEVDGGAEDAGAGGYAIEQSEKYQQLQKELIHERAMRSDVIITTANIPGKTAPVLLKEETVKDLKPGSVIIDMATASGGNCEGSRDNEVVKKNEVTIVGSSRLHEELPKEASRLYSTNLYQLVKFMYKEGVDAVPWEHDILQKTCLQRAQLESTLAN